MRIEALVKSAIGKVSVYEKRNNKKLKAKTQKILGLLLKLEQSNVSEDKNANSKT